MKKRLLFSVMSLVSILVLASLVIIPGAGVMAAPHRAAWCSSDQWGQMQFGDFIIYNDVWGATSGQTICANSATNWNVVANFPETSGVKSYPNDSLSLSGKTLNSLTSCTSSFNVSVPSSGSWEVAYDIWVPSEVMIWMNQHGAVNPIAAGYNSDGTPIPSASNVTVGGHTWNVYRGGNNVVSFVRQGGNVTSGSVDVLAVLNWIKAQGWISDGSLASFQFGFEITSAPGGLTFTTNSYSMSCGGLGGNTGGGSGATATRTRTPTTGPSPTRTRTPTQGAGPTATRTRTPTPGGSGGGSACSPVTSTITAPFTFDGAGTFCWQSSNLGTYINNWNVASLTVNGTNYTGQYVFTSSLPAKINGNWYVGYVGNFSWSHFEAK